VGFFFEVSMKPLPIYTSDLLEELDKEYPLRCILPSETMEQAHRYAGARDVIDRLRLRLERQIKKEMESNNVFSQAAATTRN